jgi:HK97 family phage major capsid protein
MSLLETITATRRVRYEGLKALVDAATAENRELTTAENGAFEAATDDIDKIDARIKVMEAAEKRAVTADKFRNPILVGALGGSDRSLAAGEIRMLKPEERMADVVDGPGRDTNAAQFLRGIVLGDWNGVDPEVRALSGISDAMGGYTVPTPLSAAIIDKARNQSVVFRAGAQTIPMTSSTLAIARLATDNTASWRPENVAITASDPQFERITLRARTLGALAKMSVELFEDTSGLEQSIEEWLGKVLALEIDRVCLRGLGAASEPLGILNQPGVTVTGSIGSPASYVAFADTPTGVLRAANATEPYTFVSSPRTFTSLESIVTGITSDKTRLKAPPAWENYANRFATNQVPINTGGASNESEAYVGDFSQLVVGMRTNLTIEASRQASDASSYAFSQLQVWVRAYLRMDLYLRHPQHFNVLTGILA